MSHEGDAIVPGGELERALLGALWAQREATARELYDRVRGSRGIVYTTVAKVLDRLVDKGLVHRRRTGGRPYIYQAVVQREATQRAMARGLIEQLSTAGPQPAVAALVGAIEDVSPQLLDELASELKARKRRRHGP